jgi:hypothetical protein
MSDETHKMGRNISVVESDNIFYFSLCCNVHSIVEMQQHNGVNFLKNAESLMFNPAVRILTTKL